MFEEDSFGFQEVVKSVLGEKRLVTVKLDEAIQGLNLRGLDEFLMKAMVYHINDTVFSGVEDSDVMLSEINNKVLRALDEYVDSFVQDEVQTYLKAKSLAEQQETLAIQERKREEFQRELSTTLKSLSQEKPQPVNIYLPETKIDSPVHVEAPIIELDIPKQEAPIVNLSLPEQPAPVVNVSIPEANIQVNVPEQEAPIVNLSVPEQLAPNIVVNVPEQTPVVNVSVEPTPVEVNNTVNVPDKKREIKITKSGNTWTGEAE